MKHELSYMIAVMKAAKEGEKIEVLNCSGTKWIDTNNPLWDWDTRDYRIKPKPVGILPYLSSGEFYHAFMEHGQFIKCGDTYQPFSDDDETCFYVKPIEFTNNNIIFASLSVNEGERFLMVSYEELTNYRWIDDTPCGKSPQTV